MLFEIELMLFSKRHRDVGLVSKQVVVQAVELFLLGTKVELLELLKNLVRLSMHAVPCLVHLPLRKAGIVGVFVVIKKLEVLLCY